MALQTTPATIVGNLINNPDPLPDAKVESPFVPQVAAAGTTQLTATPLVQQINVVTNNTTANGVMLPVALRGQPVYVYGALNAAGPIVYPPLGGTINGGTVNAGASLVARQVRIFYALDNTGLNWMATA